MQRGPPASPARERETSRASEQRGPARAMHGRSRRSTVPRPCPPPAVCRAADTGGFQRRHGHVCTTARGSIGQMWPREGRKGQMIIRCLHGHVTRAGSHHVARPSGTPDAYLAYLYTNSWRCLLERKLNHGALVLSYHACRRAACRSCLLTTGSWPPFTASISAVLGFRLRQRLHMHACDCSDKSDAKV